MIDYTKLRQALKHLEMQYANHLAAESRPELTELDREALAESVIQRFETSFDTTWKTLKRYISEEVGLAEIPNSPKGVLKLAGQQELLGESVEHWLRYADARVATAHDYSGEKAAETLAIVDSFLPDAIALYEAMSGVSWQ